MENNKILDEGDVDRNVIDGCGLAANNAVQKAVDFEQFMEAARHLGLYQLPLNLASLHHE